MRKSILILAAALTAAPAFADKKLDDAVAKAESLAEKGRPEEGIKAVQKVAEQSNSAEAYLALGRLQNRLASPEEAQTSLAKAVELSASATPDVKAEALAALSGQDLLRGTGHDALTHAEEAVKEVGGGAPHHPRLRGGRRVPRLHRGARVRALFPAPHRPLDRLRGARQRGQHRQPRDPRPAQDRGRSLLLDRARDLPARVRRAERDRHVRRRERGRG